MVAYRYVALRAKAMEETTTEAEAGAEADVELWALMRAATTSIQAVRVSPRARNRLLSDALCPKPWSSDVLLYVLLAMIDTALPPTMAKTTAAAEDVGNETNPAVTRVFTGSPLSSSSSNSSSDSIIMNELSDTQTYICALSLSHECISKLDFSLDDTWDEYLLLERRIYRMVLFTNVDDEIHHTSVYQKGISETNNNTSQKKTVLLHCMAAISAAMWARRLSHKCMATLMQRRVPDSATTATATIKSGTMGCDPSLKTLRGMLLDSYAEWVGVRFKQAVCKGRCNALCRAHDTELFGFLSNGVAACGASMSESVEAAFMPAPQVLKSIHGDYNAMKFAGHEALHDESVILYLANSIIKQKFEIPLLDCHVLLDADMVRNAHTLMSARYRAPCIACGPRKQWGVLYWHSRTARFTPGSLLNAECPLLASLAMWIKLYVQHVHVQDVMTRERKGASTPNTEFSRLAQAV